MELPELIKMLKGLKITEVVNVSPFVRVVQTSTLQTDGKSIESYREWRPWVIVVLVTALVGFCAWISIEVSVGDILLGR